jgi:aspartate aminotransferase-like enzyme
MQLRIPGPTPLPDEVLEAMSRPMISHRSAEFRALMREVTERLKACFQTSGDVLVFPGAGTGGLEAAIVNLFSPGDTVVAVTVGAFGDRFAEIAERFGLRVVRVASPWGDSADMEELRDVLMRTPNVKGVLVTHNETSTGVQNDVQAISELNIECHLRKAQRSRHDPLSPDDRFHVTHESFDWPLLVVDAVSSMGAVDIPVNRWKIDVAITGSQKAWMAAPGLTMLSVSERAWRASRRARLPRFYWDFAEARRFLDRDETPYTPAVSVIAGLCASLRLIMREGLPQVFARHEQLRDLVRARARSMGLGLLARDESASRTVTAVEVPPGLTAREIVAAVKERGILIAGGQDACADRIIRVGHMGLVGEAEMHQVMHALEGALLELRVAA